MRSFYTYINRLHLQFELYLKKFIVQMFIVFLAPKIHATCANMHLLCAQKSILSIDCEVGGSLPLSGYCLAFSKARFFASNKNVTR